ncbi:hypothetical protein IFM89_021860 [Coptis chinensis]|uniref:15-cis-phytoene synthase n=1 Tax=Coptis chinensis TaxID=261450 RepID=A0A835LK29_9MAGN|nr:hypothetical protein IFM89_021860 [Coptis chinensis]
MCSVFPFSSKTTGIEAGNKRISSHEYRVKYRIVQSSSPNKAKYKPDFHQELMKCRIAHSDLHVREIIDSHSQVQNLSMKDSWTMPESHPTFIEAAYERCGHICAGYDKSYYLGRFLDNILAVVVVGLVNLMYSNFRIFAVAGETKKGNMVNLRTTDQLIDGPSAINVSTAVFDRWEERLQDIFNGRPYDILDAALTDTVHKYPLDIKPFMHLIQGMRMDLTKSRYENFEELYEYCYYVAGAVGMLLVLVSGIQFDSPISIQKIYDAALYMGPVCP